MTRSRASIRFTQLFMAASFCRVQMPLSALPLHGETQYVYSRHRGNRKIFPTAATALGGSQFLCTTVICEVSQRPTYRGGDARLTETEYSARRSPSRFPKPLRFFAVRSWLATVSLPDYKLSETFQSLFGRSEERRVGKECRSRW